MGPWLAIQFQSPGFTPSLIWIFVSFKDMISLDSLYFTAAMRNNTGAAKRMQDIVQRRKLVDLAKAQAQEVAVLRAEVERLRMRTFPALVQVER